MAIFESCIRLLDKSYLPQREMRDEDPLRAFFGDFLEVENAIVNCENEKLRQYLLRHTLRRPRDLVHIGNCLLTRMVSRKAMNAEVIREGVSEAARGISKAYLSEIAPLVGNDLSVLEFLSRYPPSNIVTREEAEQACRSFNVDKGRSCRGRCQDCDNVHPFCRLYEVGLLGWAYLSTSSGKQVQRFLRPGQLGDGTEPEIIPMSRTYFLHPILNEHLGNDKVNRKCIVGYDLPFDPDLL